MYQFHLEFSDTCIYTFAILAIVVLSEASVIQRNTNRINREAKRQFIGATPPDIPTAQNSTVIYQSETTTQSKLEVTSSTTKLGEMVSSFSESSTGATQTVIDAVCNTGFVKCKDGRCEPFEHICGEEGIITLPTISAIITSTLVSVKTNSPDISMATDGLTLSETQGSTIPTTIATLQPLDTGCPPGYELCPDTQCEPFHFLCEEHSTGEVIDLVGR